MGLTVGSGVAGGVAARYFCCVSGFFQVAVLEGKSFILVHVKFLQMATAIPKNKSISQQQFPPEIRILSNGTPGSCGNDRPTGKVLAS